MQVDFRRDNLFTVQTGRANVLVAAARRMPVTYPPPEHPYPGKYMTYRDAARAHLLVVMKCGGCNRTVHFLASDLEKVIGPDHYAHVPPFDCSRCRTKEYLMMALHRPTAEDLGRMVRSAILVAARAGK